GAQAPQGGGGPGAAEPPAPLGESLFAYLRERDAEKARRLLKTLGTRSDFAHETVEAALDRAPSSNEPRGLLRRLPSKVPDVVQPRTYELYVPEEIPEGTKLPLWISIHGTGGNGSEALHGILPHLRGRGVIVAAPSEAADIQGQGWGFRARERQLHLAVLEEV